MCQANSNRQQKLFSFLFFSFFFSSSTSKSHSLTGSSSDREITSSSSCSPVLKKGSLQFVRQVIGHLSLVCLQFFLVDVKMLFFHARQLIWYCITDVPRLVCGVGGLQCFVLFFKILFVFIVAGSSSFMSVI